MTAMALALSHTSSVALPLEDVDEVLASSSSGAHRRLVKAAHNPDVAGAITRKPPPDIPIWTCALLTGVVVLAFVFLYGQWPVTFSALG